MSNKNKLFSFTLIMIFLLTFISLYFMEEIKVLVYGIKYVSDTPDKYIWSYEIVNDINTVSLNLSEPETNKNKVIYEDKKCKVFVEDIIKERENKYRINFKSLGTYSIDGAELVTGIKYVTLNKTHSFNMITINLDVKHKDIICHASETGIGPKLLRYGDVFSYDIFIENDSINGNINNVKVVISGLCRNVWKRI